MNWQQLFVSLKNQLEQYLGNIILCTESNSSRRMNNIDSALRTNYRLCHAIRIYVPCHACQHNELSSSLMAKNLNVFKPTSLVALELSQEIKDKIKIKGKTLKKKIKNQRDTGGVNLEAEIAAQVVG